MFTQDTMTIEVLDDGTIKTTTDKVSGANHANAEQFLKLVATLGGGAHSRARRGDAHSHGAHTHSHDHDDHDHEH